MRIGRGNRSTWRKPAPVPLCPQQIPHNLTWAGTRAAAVGSQQQSVAVLPKLQSSWEGLYKVVTWINDVVYRIQRNPRLRLMVVHVDWLAPPEGAIRDEQP
jgi:hypothetical protein